MNDEDNDPRILWHINMAMITAYADDDFLCEEPADLIVVTELIWDPKAPCEVKIHQYEHGYDPSDDPFAIFDVDMLRQIIETYGPVGEGRVRLECTRPNGESTAKTRDEIWVVLQVTPDGQRDFESYYVPMRHLIAFTAAIHKVRPLHIEPEPQDWDTGLLALIGGTS